MTYEDKHVFKREDYGIVLAPMVTPFKQNQQVDYDAAVKVGEKLIEDGKADSIILSGTTGEFHTQTFDERVTLFKVVKEALGDRIPLIAGIGSTSTLEAVALGRKAEELGFALAMILAPYYTKPSQAELYRHFKTVAESVSIPLMLYNIPIFAGVNIQAEIVGKLAEIDNIVGIKEEAELNPKQITEYANATPPDFSIYCGDDTMIIESFAAGGNRVAGIVSGCAHLIGDRLRDMIQTLQAGRVQEASEMQRKFYPLFRSLSPGDRTNPACLLKDAMRLMGYEAGIPRLPLTPGSEEEVAGVKKVMESLGLL
jgi:4-hydroxy-tetrahydrodipicolinate synthase